MGRFRWDRGMSLSGSFERKSLYLFHAVVNGASFPHAATLRHHQDLSTLQPQDQIRPFSLDGFSLHSNREASHTAVCCSEGLLFCHTLQAGSSAAAAPHVNSQLCNLHSLTPQSLFPRSGWRSVFLKEPRNDHSGVLMIAFIARKLNYTRK